MWISGAHGQVPETAESTIPAPWQLGFPQFNGNPLGSESTTNSQATYTTPSYEMPQSLVVPASTGTQTHPAAGKQVPNLQDGNIQGPDEVQLAAHEENLQGLSLPNAGDYPVLPVGNAPVGNAPVGNATIGSGTTPLTPPQLNGAIGSQIGNPVVEAPPLQEQTVHWYEYPWRWIRGWKNHAEFGIDGSNGNAETLAIQAGLEMKRKTDAYTLAIDIDYRLANTRNRTTNLREVTEDSGRFNLDYDRLLGDTPWSGFGKFGLEFDEFKAFDLRVNLNGGVGYHWIRNDLTTVVTRFGAGASREFGAPVDEWTPEGVFGFEAEHQLNDFNKLKAKIDYFPAWEDFDDFRLVTDLGWEILLNESENLSLKLALTDRYDSTPQGAKPNDVYYSLLFLVKF